MGRYSEEQIIALLKQADGGTPIEEVPQGRFQRCHFLQVVFDGENATLKKSLSEAHLYFFQ